jgi:hypothetical protein
MEMGQNRQILLEILKEKPAVHGAQTEIKLENNIANNNPSACWGVCNDVAFFIYDSIKENAKTLEIGAGISTFAFALRNCYHTAITPHDTEITAIRDYASSKSINLERVSFVAKSSEEYLPTVDITELEFVLIDGKHAFPWPIIDWFYTADRLKKGGVMMLDDLPLKSVRLLSDFLITDKERWSVVKKISHQAIAFQKLVESVHDVSWVTQPFSNKKDKLALLYNRLHL